MLIARVGRRAVPSTMWHAPFTFSFWVPKAVETEIGISSMKAILYRTVKSNPFFCTVVGFEKTARHPEEPSVSVLAYEVENLCPSIWKLYFPISLHGEIYFCCQKGKLSSGR